MQTFKNLPLLAACAVGLMMSAANPGFTQEGTSPILAFEDIDTDKDGAISAIEALAHQIDAFATFDENKDGSLVVTEYLSTRLGAASLGFFLRPEPLISKPNTSNSGTGMVMMS